MPSKDAMKKRKKRAARMIEGVCIECGGIPMDGSIYCGGCDEAKEFKLAQLQERKKTGCIRCGKPVTPGYKTCAYHRADQRRQKREQDSAKRSLQHEKVSV